MALRQLPAHVQLVQLGLLFLNLCLQKLVLLPRLVVDNLLQQLRESLCGESCRPLTGLVATGVAVRSLHTQHANQVKHVGAPLRRGTRADGHSTGSGVHDAARALKVCGGDGEAVLLKLDLGFPGLQIRTEQLLH